MRIIALYILLTLFFSVVFLVLITGYLFFFEKTNENLSLVQQWKTFYNLDDWNLPQHAYVDIDGDGKADFITYSACVFLSSVSNGQIPPSEQCRDEMVSGLVDSNFPDYPEKVGQRLIPLKSYVRPLSLRKTYLVQTMDDKWRIYHLNGFRISVFSFETSGLFARVSPLLFDYIDLLTYQISHLGFLFF